MNRSQDHAHVLRISEDIYLTLGLAAKRYGFAMQGDFLFQ